MSTNIRAAGSSDPIIERVSTPVLLKHQGAPALGGDLDASGYSIKNVDNIDAKTVNGQTIHDQIDFETMKHRQQSDAKYARANHNHTIGEIDGLPGWIDQRIKASQPKEIYAKEDHNHVLAECVGQLPVSRLVDGDKVQSLLNTKIAHEDHDHQDIRESIATAQVVFQSLQKDLAIMKMDMLTKASETETNQTIEELKKEVVELKEKPLVVADVTVTPLPAPTVKCRAEYLILDADPKNVTVCDAQGTEGAVRVTARNGKFLIRASFVATPVQPLTFTFPSSPTLCSIGASAASLTS